MDVKGLHQIVLRGMSMKSRIVFMFVLAAFVNPISVMAFETSKIGCNLDAQKHLEENRKGLADGTREIKDGMIQKKTAGDAG